MKKTKNISKGKEQLFQKDSKKSLKKMKKNKME